MTGSPQRAGKRQPGLDEGQAQWSAEDSNS
jgi:hypothetical protein